MHGHLKYLLCNAFIQFKLVHPKHTWFRLAERNIHGKIYSYHTMSGTNLYPLSLLAQNQKHFFRKHKLERFSLHCLSTMLSFTSASWDGDTVEDLSLYSPNGNVDDITDHDSDWMKEFTELKRMMNCSEEKLMTVILRYPDLKHSESLKKVKLNLTVLLKKGVKKGAAFRLLNSSTAVFLQISQEMLNELFPEDSLENEWYKHLKLYLETSLKDEKDLDNVKFLSQLLDIEHKCLLKLTGSDLLREFNTRYSAALLKVKVEFLMSKEISRNDIAYHLEILRIPLTKLERIIDEMKFTLGEVSLKLVLSKSKVSSSKRYKSSYNKVYKLLDCSYKDFSKLQSVFLNNLNQADSIEVLDYLLEKGISKQEIIKNPYILGYKLSEVQYSWEKYVNIANCDQRKLLSRILYDLEFGDDSQ